MRTFLYNIRFSYDPPAKQKIFSGFSSEIKGEIQIYGVCEHGYTRKLVLGTKSVLIW